MDMFQGRYRMTFQIGILRLFPTDMIERRRVKVRRPNTRSCSSVADTSMSFNVSQFAGFFVGSPGLIHAAAHTGLFEDSLL